MDSQCSDPSSPASLQREVPHSQLDLQAGPLFGLPSLQPTRHATPPGGTKRPQWLARSMGPTSTRGQLSRTPSTRGKATGGALVRSPTIGPGLSYSRGGSRNIHRSALAASHAPDSDSDDAMSSDGEDPEEASSDEEEFEVAIDDDCSCSACRWNLERSKEWDSQN